MSILRMREEDFKTVKLGPLTTKVMANTRSFFDLQNHYPSEEQYKGLETIAKTLELRADDKLCQDLFYISSLAPGIGKSTVLKQFIKCLIEDDNYKDVSVIVFINLVDQIKTFIKDIDINKEHYSIFISDNYHDDFETLGNPNIGYARVLFTTQKMLEARSKNGGLFKDIKEFQYKGKPRQIRVWDETILPSKTLTLEKFQISELLKHINLECPKLASDLEDWSATTLKKAKDYDIVEVLDLDKYSMEMEDLQRYYSQADERRASVEALFSFSGLPVRVRKDTLNNVILNYEDYLPDDLAPMLILDASGHLKQTYRLWNESRHNLLPLLSPPKSYRGVTIHHWDRGSGKQAYRDDWATLLEGIANTINNDIDQNEDVLVIHFKPNGKPKKSNYIPDIPKELKKLITGWNADRVKFLNWGRHTATNEYKDTKHVILASALQMPVAVNEAMGRGAKKLKTEDEFTKDDYHNTRLGEVAHNIFQAACRGKMRMSEGDGCPSGCHLYAVFSSKSIPPSWLTHIFPDSELVEWLPFAPKLTDKQTKTKDILISLAGKTIAKKELCTLLSVSKQNLINTINNDKIQYHLKKQGSELHIGGNEITVWGVTW